ncbi:MAG: PilZ domain-containing protein [Proteobacteria bacterium]|nr:MAG: PilZ domain-containing protein [Pseudomonadota bacterium]
MPEATLADNRRCAYRVRPISTDNLALALVRDNRNHIPHEVADITSKGASVRFVKGRAPPLVTGDKILVSIESPNLDGKATIMATVVFTGDSTTERLIGLAFDGTDDLEGRGSDSFFQLFNRRVAYRGVEPLSAAELPAVVMPLASAHDDKPVFPVTVRNISATGICLIVGKDPDAFMSERVNIRLSLTLPGQRSARQIRTRVCYRTVVADKIYYGCHFDWQETPNALQILEDLKEYTLDRFDDELTSVSH